jgi:trans-aconitate methyltransferase
VRLISVPGHIMDAGCGSGVLLRILAEQGCKVTGVDLDSTRVAWCKQIVPTADLHCGDIKSVQLRGKYDTIVCSEVIEHFSAEDRQAVVKNLVRHLRPGGVLVVTVPSSFYLYVVEPVWRVIRSQKYGEEVHDDDERHEVVSAEELHSALDHEKCEVVKEGRTCWGMVRWYVGRKMSETVRI